MKLQLPLPTYVISMDNDVGKMRMERIRAQFEGDIRVVRGRDYASGRDTELPEGMTSFKPVQEPYWYRQGCFSSHFIAMTRAIEEVGTGHVLVLEDDAFAIGEWPELPDGDWSVALMAEDCFIPTAGCGSCGGAWMLRVGKQGPWWPTRYKKLNRKLGPSSLAYVLNLDNIEPYRKAMSHQFGPHDWQRAMCAGRPWTPYPNFGDLRGVPPIPRPLTTFNAFVHEPGVFKENPQDHFSMTSDPSHPNRNNKNDRATK